MEPVPGNLVRDVSAEGNAIGLVIEIETVGFGNRYVWVVQMSNGHKSRYLDTSLWQLEVIK